MAGVVLCMPHIDGAYDYSAWPEKFHDYALNHRYRLPNSDPKYFHFWPTTPEDIAGEGKSFLSGEFNYQWAHGAFKRSQDAENSFQNRVTTSSLWSTFNVRPKSFLRDIAPTPLLWVATDEDLVTGPLDKDQEAFETVGGDKKMVVIHGTHLENYFGDEFEKGVKAMIEFVKAHA